jgi:uncharacterized protein
MATYKTPDVYVEEISLFPPSVAEVETAVPAFIGYTEKSLKKGVEELKLVPTKITSMAEYEESFGYGPPVDIQKVELNRNNSVTSTKIESTFYMYDALRLFYNNGGGKCCIISIGLYSNTTTPKLKDFTDGLEVLKKKDEPTLIVFPDGVLLDEDIYTLQALALQQANDLQDRFVVCDLLESADLEFEDSVDQFRDKIGINYLKYGAAYTPWLKTNLSKTVKYSNIKDVIWKNGSQIGLDKLTSEPTVIQTITNLGDALNDNIIINGDKTVTGIISQYLDSLSDKPATLQAGYNTRAVEFKAAVNVELAKLEGDSPAGDDELDVDGVVEKYQNLIGYIFNSSYQLVNEWAKSGTSLKTNDYAVTALDTVKNYITSSLKSELIKLASYITTPEEYIGGADWDDLYTTGKTWDAAAWGSTTFLTVTADYSIYEHQYSSTDLSNQELIENMKSAESKILSVFDKLNTAVYGISDAAETYITNFESALKVQFPLYKNILDKIGSELTVIPPSGAVVGVYAAVDRSRGVWKAPANVSLTSVSGLTETIDSKEQEDLNVDVTAGKSINAIRAFTGKGVLIWGARTLAGNDNEWRYISVRRFFNMVEESVKKSTYWAVFEPNDANTWIKVKSMIENYLTLKWKDGALAGAKPEDAFFVNVGLGSTMTVMDILEGRMNVEIGMAVVRPAEFIILKFSHKMQES